ncbi:hypothetical protein GCM10022242_13960 [Nocardioides panacisoli]|uniref:DUF222 domain-containing protein n=1 Tax=Nocardioides panacisoli TaxID=627624 RepID=A0ABP7I942_9ACTN
MDDHHGPAGHPVLAALGSARAALKDVRDVQPTFMTTTAKRQALLEVTALQAQVAELRSRLLASAGDVAEDDGARDVGAWVSQHTRCDLRTGRADVDLATALDRKWSRLAAGMADGTVSPAQAKVIVDALDALPADLSSGMVGRAEEMLIG